MSTIVVTPPAAAARVADAKPSHSVRPGSLTCTWVSTRPGSSTSSSPRSTLARRSRTTSAVRAARPQTIAPVVDARRRRDARRPAARIGRGRPRPAVIASPEPPRSASPRSSAIAGHAARPRSASTRTAVEAAQQEAGQGLGGRRLVEDAGGAEPPCPGSRAAARPRRRRAGPSPEEQVRRREPGRQLRRVQVPALVEPTVERAPDQPARAVRPVAGPSRVVRPEHVGGAVREPDAGPAAASCITCLAWSATGWSMAWCSALIPSAAL